MFIKFYISKIKLVFGLLLAAALICVGASRTVAQNVNGTIVGTVRDEQGAAVPNASVSAKNRETGFERTATSDGSGGFTITSVPSGTYDVTVSAQGFRMEVRSGVTMTVGASVQVDFKLNLGAVQQTVTVTGAAPQIDTTTSTITALVNDTVIRQLPLNGRDWLQLGTLQAGVLIGLTKNAGLDNNVSHGSGMYLSISGGRPFSNVYMVDGLVINDMANKSPGSALGINLGVDSIKEFSVLTSTSSAAYGRASGGVVNSISKSGTNSIHGTAFYFARNSALDARNFFDLAQVPPFHRHQFGAAIGGPIKKDKLFYFANYEGLRQFLSLSNSANTLSPNARNGILANGTVVQIDPRIQPYLAMFPKANGQITGDTAKYNFPGGQRGTEDYGFGRIDYTLNASTSIYGTYSIDNANVSSPDVFNEKLLGDTSREQRVVVTMTHTFTPTLLNTLTVGVNRVVQTGGVDEPGSATIPQLTDTSLGFLPGANNPGNITVTGILDAPGGIGADGGDQSWWTDPQFDDSVAWVKGRNDIKMGFSSEFIRDNVDIGANPLGNWQFGSVQDLLTVAPFQFNSALPGLGTYRRLREKIFGLYVQDNVRVRSNLTVNLGLRYEPTTTMKELNGKAATLHSLTDPTIYTGNPLYKNWTLLDFSPRIGVAWDPTGNGKTAIRAGFGMFNVLPLPDLLIGTINHTVPFNHNAAVQNPPSSSFPNQIVSLLVPGSGMGLYFGQDSHRSYTMQWNLNIERQITNSMSFTAAYVGSRGVNLPLHYNDVNVVPPSLVTVTPDGHLQFPTSGPIQRINPNPIFHGVPGMLWDGWSKYNALQVSVNQRFNHGLTFQGVYVWSKNIDIGAGEVNGGDNANLSPNPWFFDPNYGRGLSDWDVPQHFALNVVWNVPSPHFQMALPRYLLSGWQLGGIFTVQSGMPFSAEISTDAARTGNISPHERPDYNPAGCPNGETNPGNPDNYINLSCFSYPAPGQLGNLGRNTMRSPGLEDFDFSLFKNQAVGENRTIQLRAEIFNVLNHTNFQAQAVTVFDRQGNIDPASSILGPPTATTSRQVQLGIKFIF
jgi:Carboxypeptidase regulatory-like domain/TonB dependent receptor-like, beta-barrel